MKIRFLDAWQPMVEAYGSFQGLTFTSAAVSMFRQIGQLFELVATHRCSAAALAVMISVFWFLVSPTSSVAQDNGITVGAPKVYDNRSLTIMLDQLTARLDQLNAVDQQPLAKALGTFQGSTERDITRSFQVTAGIPKLTTSNSPQAASITGTGGNESSSTGNPGPNSSSSGTSKSASGAGSNSSSATPPELIASPGFKPQFSESPSDLLADQVELTYQIFNLRMLLERSLTDRLLNGRPRRQVIVSFNVTIDPPRDATDAAAYVEITMGSDKGPLALVATMPQEKTYNATALSSSSTAFGGSAVAKIVTIGYNQQKRSQIFFLYRDSDTLALEPPQNGNQLKFGWVFRPVLGRRSVSPGMRQMFAVISLPTTDKMDDLDTLPLQVHAVTRWMHYDRDTLTTFQRPGFWDWSAKHLPKDSNLTFQPLEAYSTAYAEKMLQPVVNYVQSIPTSADHSVIKIGGRISFQEQQ